MVIWEYDVPAAARSLGWAVVANNVEALKILLDCGYSVAGLLTLVGALSRWAVGKGVFWLAGMDGVDAVGELQLFSAGWRMMEILGSYLKDGLSLLGAG